MKVHDSIFQLDATTLRVAGVGLWAYDTTARKLWYSGFADNLHITSEPLCVDIDSYLTTVAEDDQKKVVEYILSMHTSTPLSNLRYRIHEVSLGYNVDESSCVTCFVSDTGVGITNVQQKQIFDNFYQTDTFEEGIGLGLPLCKLIIQELGGHIWVESAPEVGTTIYFTLPPIVPRSL